MIMQSVNVTFQVEEDLKTQVAMEEAENNEDMYGPFDSVEALMEALNV